MSNLINYKVKFENTVFYIGVRAEDTFGCLKTIVFSVTKVPLWRQSYPGLISTAQNWNDDCKMKYLALEPDITLEMVDNLASLDADIKESTSHQAEIHVVLINENFASGDKRPVMHKGVRTIGTQTVNADFPEPRVHDKSTSTDTSLVRGAENKESKGVLKRQTYAEIVARNIRVLKKNF